MFPADPRRRTHDAQALIETALALPMIVIVLAGLIDYARIYNAQQTLDRVARAGVVFGTTMKEPSIYPSDPEIRNHLRNSVLPPLTPESLLIERVDMVQQDLAGRTSLSVEVSFPVTLITPVIGSLFSDGRVTVHATARLPYPQSAGATPEPGPTPTPTPPYVIDDDGGIDVTDPGVSARVRVLGKQLQYGAGGPPIPVTLRYSFRGDSFMEAFGGSPVNGGEEFNLPGLTRGDELSFAARARLTDGGRTLFDRTYVSDVREDFGGPFRDRYHQYTLRDGDPAIYFEKPGFAGQTPLRDFLIPFVDPGDGTVNLGTNEVIVLFEYNSDYSSAATDFQDLVLLVQFYRP